MCQNLQWLVCAGKGRLPGQGGRAMHFATPPSKLDTRTWITPISYPCEHGGCGVGELKYVVEHPPPQRRRRPCGFTVASRE